MPEFSDRILAEISPPLRQTASVTSALARLADGSPRELDDLVKLALDNNAPMGTRLAASTLIAAMREPDEQTIQNLLSCEDRTVFIETLKSIKHFGAGWGAKYLIVAAGADKDPDRRAVFAWALGGYPTNTDAERTLIHLARHDGSASVREHAIESLGEFHNDKVVKTLLRILAQGSATERFWALFSLGTLADPAAADAVRLCLDDHTLIPGYNTIAEEAAWALARIQRGA